MTEVRLNIAGLEKLKKAFGGKLPEVRVGIMGANASRVDDTESGLTNAQIGVFHEFGTSRLPMRSFLRVPIATMLPKKLRSILNKEALKQIAETKSIMPMMLKIAAMAEAIVLEGFATAGYGKWPASRMARKKVQQTLVETGQLRDSITSEVK